MPSASDIRALTTRIATKCRRIARTIYPAPVSMGTGLAASMNCEPIHVRTNNSRQQALPELGFDWIMGLELFRKSEPKQAREFSGGNAVFDSDRSQIMSGWLIWRCLGEYARISSWVSCLTFCPNSGTRSCAADGIGEQRGAEPLENPPDK